MRAGALLGAGCYGFGQRFTNGFEKLIEADRFGQVVGGSCFERLDRRGGVAVRSEHHDANGGVLSPQPAEHFEPVHVRQVEIEQHQIRGQGFEGFQALLAPFGVGEDVPSVLEVAPREAPERRLVFHE